jgi:hypothetical protein
MVNVWEFGNQAMGNATWPGLSIGTLSSWLTIAKRFTALMLDVVSSGLQQGIWTMGFSNLLRNTTIVP